MKKLTIIAAAIALCTIGCTKQQEIKNYSVEKFYDLEILRYDVPDFNQLTLQQKQLVYYLTEAALQGRDILYDQNCKYNLAIRRTLEAVYQTYPDKQDEQFLLMEKYLKRVWFSNGIHHHYASYKFLPEFSQEWFVEAVNNLPDGCLKDILGEEQLNTILPVMFDPNVLPKRVNQAAGQDLILTSANNYYEGVTQAEAEAYYAANKDESAEPKWIGLNAKLVKKDGVVQEETYKVGGLYSQALERIVYWLEKAQAVAETEEQKLVIEKLISFYQTGDLQTFNEYCIAWVKDVESRVDFVNGFTETYGDPLGMKASWESIVNFKDLDATKRTETLSANAQWFEDHSPVDSRFKKEKVKGVSAKVITAAILGGDLYPSTAIGINLPNSDWVRKEHGSKSVTIGNLTEAYNLSAKGNGFRDEFIDDPKVLQLVDNYADVTDDLHTDLHECLGHGSGKLLDGVSTDSLKAYGSALEEGRADLFGLYYVADPKMVELGLTPDMEAYKAQYYTYMMNGLMTQLVRIQLGNDIEEAHMRNRAFVARWCYEKGKKDNVVVLEKKNGKTYVRINDYEKLRDLFGQLLAEVQRIKSTGDFAAAQALIEGYGVKIDPELHKEVLDRYEKLNLAPYKGFINPVYTALKDANGNITDVKVSYKEGYADQMLRYSKDYATLPLVNE
mgnify:CR=1 FL=1